MKTLRALSVSERLAAMAGVAAAIASLAGFIPGVYRDPKVVIARSHGFDIGNLIAVLIHGPRISHPARGAIGDAARTPDRATSIGIYRLWRDSGYAVGAIVAGTIADAAGFPSAIMTVAALTGVSGLLVAVRMREAMSPPPTGDAATELSLVV